MGSTGSGKSTLLNAVLGAHMLPVGQMHSCTAAVCQVAYSDQDHYSAEIEFHTREHWLKKLETCKAEISVNHEEEEKSPNSETGMDLHDLSRVYRDKILSFYQLDRNERISIEELQALNEPSEIERAFNNGHTSIQSNELNKFRREISVYLSSKGCFWPIVKTVRINGPFDCINNGMILVDLPGINDPNETLEQITRNYLKNASHVWIVFNIKRPFTRDTTDLIHSHAFFRQVVLEGKTDAITFVGTHTEVIDPDAAIEEFGLDNEASEIDTILERNRRAKKEIPRQIREVCLQLAKRAGVDLTRGEDLAKKMADTKVYTVSSLEYLRLVGISRKRSGPLTKKDQTEIPSLQKHVEDLGVRFGTSANENQWTQRIHLLQNEIQQSLQAQQTHLKLMKRSRKKTRQQLEQDVKAVHITLGQEMLNIQNGLAQELEASNHVLQERFARAKERAQTKLDGVIDGWSNTHWNTLKAVVKHDGKYKSSKGRRDFSQEIADTLLDAIVFDWQEFYDNMLSQILDRKTVQLDGKIHEVAQQLKAIFDRVKGRDKSIIRDLNKMLKNIEKILKEKLKIILMDMRQKIDERRRSIHETITGQIHAHMKKSYKKAAGISGRGIKDRIVQVLEKHARDVSCVMFNDTERVILEGIGGLLEWLKEKYNDMPTSVNDKFWMLIENFKLGIHDMPVDEIELELKSLKYFEKILNEQMGQFTS